MAGATTINRADDAPVLAHRRDIDGLRAVAIVPILLLHCGVTALDGGFIGVDVFFVISGYLITSILRVEMAAGGFSAAGFYRRRAVRLLPALAAVLIATLATGTTVLLAPSLRDLGLGTAATAAFASNLWFYATTDYFASGTKPLVHTWSLGVEEQFYLLYPWLMWWLRDRSRRSAARVVAGLCLASLGIGAWLAWRDPSAGFYLLPARTWQLGAGALVALGAWPTIGAARWRGLICCGALATIVLWCTIDGNGRPFPVPMALPPTLAAATLIAYGERGPTARLLGLAPLRAIGLLSYSAYLWHRPIIAFYEDRFGSTLRPADTLILLVATAVAATASYTLIERPALRRWRASPTRPVLVAAGGLLALLAALGLATAALAPVLRPLPPALARVAAYLAYDGSAAQRAQFGQGRCFVLPSEPTFDPSCLAAAPGRPAVLLMGDSHAAHFAAALRALRPGERVLQATAADCRPVLDGRAMTLCRRVREQAFAAVARGGIGTVVLSGRWFPHDLPALQRTIPWLRARGVRVTVLGPSVEYDVAMPSLIVRAADDPTVLTRERRTDRRVLDRRMRALVAGSGARYVSLIDLECPRGRCRVLADDGAPFHFDHSHLTPSAARTLLLAAGSDRLAR